MRELLFRRRQDGADLFRRPETCVRRDRESARRGDRPDDDARRAARFRDAAERVRVEPIDVRRVDEPVAVAGASATGCVAPSLSIFMRPGNPKADEAARLLTQRFIMRRMRYRSRVTGIASLRGSESKIGCRRPQTSLRQEGNQPKLMASGKPPSSNSRPPSSDA